MATRRHFTQEYKDQAGVWSWIRGAPSPRARSIDVHEMTLGKWVKKAKAARRAESGDAELSSDERAELEKLRADNAQLRMERDFAKKVATWFAKDQP